MTPVEQLLRDDFWTVAGLPHPEFPGVVRFRKPVLCAVEGYDRLVMVLWAYADEGSGAMPDATTSAEMTRFENHLCAAVQDDAHAVLAAVVTFDGARQWVFYTREVVEFGRRLSVIPDYYGEPYPIEITTQADPTWSYLRDQVLQRVPKDR